jgi:anti-anti-sigma regulatory factor
MALADYVTITEEGDQIAGIVRLRAEPKLCNQLSEICEALQQEPKVSLTLDCHSVDHVSDESGSHLLKLLKILRDESHTLKLSDVAKPTYDILESMGITGLIPIGEDGQGSS